MVFQVARWTASAWRYPSGASRRVSSPDGVRGAGTGDEALNPYLRSIAARRATSALQVRAASTSCGRAGLTRTVASHR